MRRIDQLQLPTREMEPPKPLKGVAAVAIAIGWNTKTQQEEILLTKRTETVMTHKGQVGFPGGVWEESDQSLFETAIREAEEEVGLKRADFQVLGTLTPVTTRGDVWIYPWVGRVEFPYDFHASVNEVAKIMMLPVEVLIEKGLKKVEVPIGTFKFQSVAIEWDGELIWGATARLLQDLRTYLLATGIREKL